MKLNIEKLVDDCGGAAALGFGTWNKSHNSFIAGLPKA